MKFDWNKELLEEITVKSYSQKELLHNLGLKLAGGNYINLRKYLSLYNISTLHFKKDKLKSGRDKRALNDVLIENSDYSRSTLKKRLYKEELLFPICSICGQDENWKGTKISLIIDHINGIKNDNRLENLRIVCPNCNAGLDTFSGKNVKKTRKKYFCKCGVEIMKNSKLCNSCKGLTLRKTERPDKEQLLKEVEELGYSAVGRKYGVSDNAIRKWTKTC